MICSEQCCKRVYFVLHQILLGFLVIIQKSKIHNLELKLSQIQITDSFLMFLANSQKMSKVKYLDISYCSKVTQNGVNSLLISPYCKNIQILNVSGTPVIQSSIQSLLAKTSLKHLLMNHCQKQQDQIDSQMVLKNIKLNKLQALGMNISPVFSSNIQYLKIDTEISIDFLKQLKDMGLKQLKLKLVDQKKNLIGGFLGTIGNFYSKQVNPVKLFAQGRSNKTLKVIDLKFKILINITKLHLNFKECPNIIYPNKLFTPIANFTNIQQISISFQYCPLKELSTLDFLQNIYSLKKLISFELNLSFTQISISMISNILNQLPNKLPNCKFLFYLIGNETKQTLFDKQALQTQGVQVIF